MRLQWVSRLIGKSRSISPLYQQTNPLVSLTEDEKVALLNDLNAEARKQDPRITQVIVSLNGLHETIVVMRANGEVAADIRPLIRIDVSVVIEEKGRREKASAGGGGRRDYFKPCSEEARFFAREAVRQAQVKLRAIAAPAGAMPVVLGPGWPGVLLHEAVGHGLEADFNRKGASAFSGKLGEQVTSSLCTIVDDGTLAERRGSLSVDDEGNPTQSTVLVEEGILKQYMQDNLNAKLMKMKPTGNGRRESYSEVPLPRMTNTYMLGGDATPGDIVADLKDGIYAVGFGGGQVDITNGKFVFSCTEAYRVRNGVVGEAVKGATLIGDGATALKQIRALGNDMALDPGMGNCGKQGQWVPVGVGQPTVMIGGLTVGGSAT